MNGNFCRITAFFLIMSLLLTPVSALKYDEDEKISVIVTLDDGKSLHQAVQEISSLIGALEYKYEYSTLFNGFCALLPESKIPLLKSLDCVEQIYKDTEYEALAAEEEGYTVVYAPGSEPSYFPLRGQGAVVAVIDDGFYVKHELFTLGDNTNLALTQKNINEILHFTKASRLYPRVSIKNIYESEKIPFAFDYADADTNVSSSSNHGTAMLSLAAGNPVNGDMPSAAPSAQALAMKVYSDLSGTAKTSAVIAALEDACILGADAVCLSLGSPCGFSETGLYDTLLEEAINKLYKKGITVACPAGNDAAIGTNSVFYNHYGYYEPLTSLPDSGTINAPSTAPGALSAASADTFSARTYAFRLCEDNSYIPFSDSNETTESSGKKSFYAHTGEKTFEYVIIDGLGNKEDFIKDGKKLDLTGKIALVARGEIAFAEKVNNAAECGAEAVIIYDNTESDTPSIRTGMQLEGVSVPAILISNSDGKRMISTENKQIYIDPKIIYVTNAGITPSPSSFTSRGPTPTLDLKPELAASGSSVAVADRNRGYSTVSGTSASAAYAAGLAAAVSANLDLPDTNIKADRVKAILMNCAEPMKEFDGSLGRYYSVTLQGAGYLSDHAFIEPEILLTSDSQSKILLGNKLDKTFEIPLTLENLTDKPQSVDLSLVIGTESYESLKYSELCHEKDSFYKKHGVMLYDYLGKNADDAVHFTGDFIAPLVGASVTFDKAELNEDSKSFSGAKITLEPFEQLDITLYADLSGADFDALGEVFENGMLIQGYVFAKESRTYSLPMLGFYGDFYALDPLDAFLSEGGALYGGSYLYTFFADETRDYTVYLGTNYDITAPGARIITNSELVVISPVADSAEGSIFLNVSLLRNLKSLKADIYSEDGRYIYSPKEIKGLKKAYYTESSDDSNSYAIELWNCRDKDNDKYVYDDGKYICRLSATDASGREFKYELYFIIDSEKPSLADCRVRNEGKKTYLDVTVSDNNFIRDVSAYAFNDTELDPVFDTMPHDKLLAETGAGGEFNTSFDITGRVGQYIYIEITDLAFNKNLVRIRV